MSRLRRFVNLLVESSGGLYSLRRIDLSRHPLFYPTPAAAAAAGPRDLRVQREEEYEFQWPKLNDDDERRRKKKMKRHEAVETLRQLPSIVSMAPSPPTPAGGFGFDCFPLAESESKVVFADHAGRAFLYDADGNRFTGMPSLHAPKGDSPVAVSIAAQGEEESKLYVMDNTLRPESSGGGGGGSLFQFEVFDHRKPEPTSPPWEKYWHCDPLPPPPFVFDSGGMVESYAVIGHVIVVSVSDVGTYCFDTASRSWSRAGEWALPFAGKAEYVPELKLWFGIAAKGECSPCAADLSPVARGEPPSPGYIWEDLDLPEEWEPSWGSHLVVLGSGRFCIARFFQLARTDDNIMNDHVEDVTFPVFTGLEVLPPAPATATGDGGGSGDHRKEGLRMIKHKSRRYAELDDDGIRSVKSVL
uniref:DUF1618 domain-containing protein n=1 Tax=Oryza glumipatula TaxID=40148 RepID=A0A0D9ZTP2_9ORYZ